MLRKLKNLKGFTIRGNSEKLGKVEDFYFDQYRLVVRYLVIDTGTLFLENLTLISPKAFEEINYETEEIFVNLTTEKLKEGPNIEKNKPVSRKTEEKLVNHFGWPLYWTEGAYTPRWTEVQGESESVRRDKISNNEEALAKQKQTESDLRSFNEITGYHIQAKDDEFGHLEDLFFNEEDWVIRYLLVDTRNILPGGKDVLIAPEWLQNIDWNEEKIYVNKTKEEIKSAPEYEEGKTEDMINRNYEEKLYNHYNETRYWQ
ncbi:MAG: PRC-barrel domain-containing protein [Halanaerobium sp.]